MKFFIFLLFGICLSNQVFASGCRNESFYNLEAIANAAGLGAGSCYFEKLKKIAEPQTMAARQYNYFADKINEYAAIFGAESIDSASLEYMFYPAIRKSALANEDARKIEFTYVQTFNCLGDAKAEKVTSEIRVSGVTGLTGVCLMKRKVQP